jgi:riboflavin kinase/FMN adenylyltransferase
MTKLRKAELLKKFGVKEILFLDFDEVKNLSPIEFLEFLRKKFAPSIISCGFNYRFGKDGAGDTEFLKSYCLENGIKPIVCGPVLKNGRVISSTDIRNMIKSGEIRRANECIYNGFSFKSTVVDGDKRGRTLGFPTINQNYPELLVKPKFGVYVTETEIDGKVYRAVTNIGIRPTFKNKNITAETYIIGFSGNLYGREIEIKLRNFMREEIKFNSIEELKKTVLSDIEKAENYRED